MGLAFLFLGVKDRSVEIDVPVPSQTGVKPDYQDEGAAKPVLEQKVLYAARPIGICTEILS